MRLNSFIYGIAVLAIFLGTIAGAQAAGFWSVSGKVTTSGEKVTATGTNVDEIKGWMTIGDVSAAYNVPVVEMLAAFDLPADTPPTTQIKTLESDTFSVTGLREWLQARLNP